MQYFFLDSFKFPNVHDNGWFLGFELGFCLGYGTIDEQEGPCCGDTDEKGI